MALKVGLVMGNRKKTSSFPCYLKAGLGIWTATDVFSSSEVSTGISKYLSNI